MIPLCQPASRVINLTSLLVTGGITVTAYKHIYFAYYFSKFDTFLFYRSHHTILTAVYTTEWAFQLIKYKHRILYKE